MHLASESTGPCGWCGTVVHARLGDDGDGYPVMRMECHRAPCGRWCHVRNCDCKPPHCDRLGRTNFCVHGKVTVCVNHQKECDTWK